MIRSEQNGRHYPTWSAPQARDKGATRATLLRSRLAASLVRGVLAAFLFCSLGLQGQEAQPSENQVKAVWLLNFARFIDWPSNSFDGARSPIVLGIVGKDPFWKDLEKTFEGKNVKGRTFVLKRSITEQDAKDCHILFFPGSERRRFRDLHDKVKGLPTLTVGEFDEFTDQGGIINFVLKDGSVRFEINLKAAQSAGLNINANLLKVAVSVKGKYD